MTSHTAAAGQKNKNKRKNRLGPPARCVCVCNKPRYILGGWGVLLSIHFLAITGLMVIYDDLLLFFGSRILHERVDGVTSSGANCIGTDMDALFIPAIVSRFLHTHRSNANSAVVVVVVVGLDCDHKSLPLIVCSFFDFRLLGRVVLLSLPVVVRMLFLLLPRTMDTFDDSIFSRPSNNKTLES